MYCCTVECTDGEIRSRSRWCGRCSSLATSSMHNVERMVETSDAACEPAWPCAGGDGGGHGRPESSPPPIEMDQASSLLLQFASQAKLQSPLHSDQRTATQISVGAHQHRVVVCNDKAGRSPCQH